MCAPHTRAIKRHARPLYLPAPNTPALPTFRELWGTGHMTTFITQPPFGKKGKEQKRGGHWRRSHAPGGEGEGTDGTDTGQGVMGDGLKNKPSHSDRPIGGLTA